jgi:hypothetical protein
VIESLAIQYPQTRALAAQIYARFPSAQGLLWTSKQDDRAPAIMLFGDRIEPDALQLAHPSMPLLYDDVLDEIYALAEMIGVNIIPGIGS